MPLKGICAPNQKQSSVGLVLYSAPPGTNPAYKCYNITNKIQFSTSNLHSLWFLRRVVIEVKWILVSVPSSRSVIHFFPAIFPLYPEIVVTNQLTVFHHRIITITRDGSQLHQTYLGRLREIQKPANHALKFLFKNPKGGVWWWRSLIPDRALQFMLETGVEGRNRGKDRGSPWEHIGVK